VAFIFFSSSALFPGKYDTQLYGTKESRIIGCSRKIKSALRPSPLYVIVWYQRIKSALRVYCLKLINL